MSLLLAIDPGASPSRPGCEARGCRSTSTTSVRAYLGRPHPTTLRVCERHRRDLEIAGDLENPVICCYPPCGRTRAPSSRLCAEHDAIIVAAKINIPRKGVISAETLVAIRKAVEAADLQKASTAAVASARPRMEEPAPDYLGACWEHLRDHVAGGTRIDMAVGEVVDLLKQTRKNLARREKDWESAVQIAELRGDEVRAASAALTALGVPVVQADPAEPQYNLVGRIQQLAARGAVKPVARGARPTLATAGLPIAWSGDPINGPWTSADGDVLSMDGDGTAGLSWSVLTLEGAAYEDRDACRGSAQVIMQALSDQTPAGAALSLKTVALELALEVGSFDRPDVAWTVPGRILNLIDDVKRITSGGRAMGDWSSASPVREQQPWSPPGKGVTAPSTGWVKLDDRADRFVGEGGLNGYVSLYNGGWKAEVDAPYRDNREDAAADRRRMFAAVGVLRAAPLSAELLQVEAIAARVAVCPTHGRQTTCDEDRCCRTCGRDLVVCADGISADVLVQALREARDSGTVEFAEAQARATKREAELLDRLGAIDEALVGVGAPDGVRDDPSLPIDDSPPARIRALVWFWRDAIRSVLPGNAERATGERAEPLASLLRDIRAGLEAAQKAAQPAPVVQPDPLRVQATPAEGFGIAIEWTLDTVEAPRAPTLSDRITALAKQRNELCVHLVAIREALNVGPASDSDVRLETPLEELARIVRARTVCMLEERDQRVALAEEVEALKKTLGDPLAPAVDALVAWLSGPGGEQAHKGFKTGLLYALYRRAIEPMAAAEALGSPQALARLILSTPEPFDLPF